LDLFKIYHFLNTRADLSFPVHFSLLTICALGDLLLSGWDISRPTDLPPEGPFFIIIFEFESKIHRRLVKHPYANSLDKSRIQDIQMSKAIRAISPVHLFYPSSYSPLVWRLTNSHLDLVHVPVL